MKKLLGSFPVKFLAVLLYAGGVFGVCASAAVIVASFELGFYMVPKGLDTYIAAIPELVDVSGYSLGFFLQYEFPLRSVFELRWWAVALGITLLVAVITLFVFLICGAGRKKDQERVLSPFDRIPLDLTVAAVILAGVILIVATNDLDLYVAYGYWPRVYETVLEILLICAAVTVGALLVLYLCRTFAARVKAGGWWRNTLIYMSLGLVGRVLKLFWRGAKAVGRRIAELIRAVPFAWRAILVTVGVLLGNLLLTAAAVSGAELAGFVLFILDLLVLNTVILASYQLSVLQKAGKKLAKGDMAYKTDTKKLTGDFRRHGEDLNAIADGMKLAVDRQMRSERMKTELITNVSHDIKTPLTSIVNYVDLLRKDPPPEEREQYLEVLSRQAARLKKLTVDLVDASKASTGAVTVELQPTNLRELIDQAVAEYGERFANASLTPVVDLPEGDVTVLADGRHLWRVLDNLLGNAVKYAQPGTRVYLEAALSEREAVLTVKNISRERLGISPEELMERFVRGDSSRSTEGSGLGLSIARSLTELMGGSFTLAIDGDLFKAKVCLTTPGKGVLPGKSDASKTSTSKPSALPASKTSKKELTA